MDTSERIEELRQIVTAFCNRIYVVRLIAREVAESLIREVEELGVDWKELGISKENLLRLVESTPNE